MIVRFVDIGGIFYHYLLSFYNLFFASCAGIFNSHLCTN